MRGCLEDVRGAGLVTAVQGGNAPCGDGPRDVALDCRSGRDGFETAAQATSTERAVGLDDHMPDLAGEAPNAAMETTVQHDTRRDAGADAEICEILVADDPAVMEAGG